MENVLDASVAFKWFVHEDGYEKAGAVLIDVLENPQNYSVPELFYFELLAALLRRFGELSPDQTRLFQRLLNLRLQRHTVTSELLGLMPRFVRHGISGYDAAYLAVAERVGGKWLTFDREAHRRVAHLRLSECLD